LLFYISFTLLELGQEILGGGAGHERFRSTWNQRFILHRRTAFWEPRSAMDQVPKLLPPRARRFTKETISLTRSTNQNNNVVPV
jgi:hypothetical protein